MAKELTLEDRKKIYKLIKVNDFKIIKNGGRIDKALIREYSKGHLKVNKAQIDDYVEKYFNNWEDPVVKIYRQFVAERIQGEIKELKPLFKIAIDKKYDEIIEAIKDKYDIYEDAFKKGNYDFEFDILLRYFSVPDETDNKSESKNDVTKLLSNKDNELTEWKNKYRDLQNDYKKTEKENKKEIQKLKEQLKESKSSFTCKETSKKISKVIKQEIKGKTYDEVYTLLNQLETQAMSDNDYSLIKQILGSKFTIIENKERLGDNDD